GAPDIVNTVPRYRWWLSRWPVVSLLGRFRIRRPRVPPRASREGQARPGAAVPVQDGAIPAYRPDVARPAPPDAVEGVRRAARDARPGAAVPVHDGTTAAYRPDVARPAPPVAGEPVRRAARDARPDAAVPVQDGATAAHRPDVAPPAPPNAVERLRPESR